MHEPLISFGTEQFSRIFPFYLLINSDSGIAAYGKSIAKLQQIEQGQPFADSFKLTSPRTKKNDFQALKELTGQEVTLDFAHSNKNSLHGQFEFLDQQNQLLFIGTPFVQPIDETNDRHLAPDPAKHDRSTVSGTDIEQQKQLEHQLRINEKRYRDLFNYSQAFIFTHDLQGKLLSVNPDICENLGIQNKS